MDKSIILSKRANIMYLEHCKVRRSSDALVYTDKQGTWNIPVKNTIVLLLGQGTSISCAAIRLAASSQVLIGFAGTGGSPLFSAVEWAIPQNEYRETKYMQSWMRHWFNDDWRLLTLKSIQVRRIDLIESIWGKLDRDGFSIDAYVFSQAMKSVRTATRNANDVKSMMGHEGVITRKLYGICADYAGIKRFKRNHDGKDYNDQFKYVNDMLTTGNYMAYGLAASALWVIGISHAFPVSHGHSRRGALVFDIADIIKDAIILPTVFMAVKKNIDGQAFRSLCIENLLRFNAMDEMIDAIKAACES